MRFAVLPLPGACVVAATLATPGGTWAQTVPVTLRPLDPIGCFECDGPELFGSIGVVAITADGGVVVSDRDEPMIRVFDGEGRSVATFGRRGQGPGELRFVSGLAPLPDGGVMTSDMMQPRLTAYGPDGTVRGTTRTEAAIVGLRASPDGGSVVAQEAQWSTMSVAVHLVDAAGETVATPIPTTVGRFLDKDDDPIAPGLLSMAVDRAGRVAVAYGYRYEIMILDGSGEEVATISRDVARTERTPEEIAVLADRLARGPGAAEAVAAGGRASDAPPPPNVDPLRPHFGLGALAWDEAGRLWVKTARGGPGRTIFDLFDRDGAFLGEVPIEVDILAWSVGKGMLVGVREDPEFGVHTVARWRVVG